MKAVPTKMGLGETAMAMPDTVHFSILGSSEISKFRRRISSDADCAHRIVSYAFESINCQSFLRRDSIRRIINLKPKPEERAPENVNTNIS